MSNYFESYKVFRIILITLTSFISIETFSQIGLIKDSDGYTNVRKEPNSKSEIIHVLKENELFFYDYTVNDNEWIEVYIPKNKYIQEPYLCKNTNDLYGYIHKSRLKDLGELSKYKGQKFSFKYNTIPFSIEDKIIEYSETPKLSFINFINGLYPYGIDGGLPKVEIQSIEVLLNNERLHIPKVLFQNLYEIGNEIEIYTSNGFYYVSQWNSDGAGGYEVVWSFNTDGLIQRLIFIP